MRKDFERVVQDESFLQAEMEEQLEEARAAGFQVSPSYIVQVGDEGKPLLLPGSRSPSEWRAVFAQLVGHADE